LIQECEEHEDDRDPKQIEPVGVDIVNHDMLMGVKEEEVMRQRL
jgi:hypothetical protein